MNDPKPLNFRKLFWLGVLILVLVYGFGEPYFEKLLGVDLPSIRDSGQATTVQNSGPANSGTSTSRTAIDPEISSRQESATLEKPKSSVKSSKQTDSNSSLQPFLTPTGKKNRLRSPAGLIYGEHRGEHRVDHVLRHAADDKSRRRHSVFKGTKLEILKTIDEAYDLVKAKSPRVTTTQDKELHFRVKYLVDMKRKIGYFGGQEGHRQNHPPRSKIALVLDNGKFVVTAYPDR